MKGLQHAYITNRIGQGVASSSSGSIVTRLRAGRPDFDTRQGLGLFLFATASRSALGTTQPPSNWILGLFPRG